MANDILMTPLGKSQLDDELTRLVKIEREKIKTALSEARAHGDLSENADYHAAKEKQSQIEGRVLEVQGKIANAKVVDSSKSKSPTIVFGAIVDLYDCSKDCKITYQIVGEDESNLKLGKISYSCPLGKALIGKEEGDTAIVRAPKGDLEYEVESFRYV